MRTRLGDLKQKSVSGGGADNGSITALSSTSNTGPLKLPELERQKFSGDRLEETPTEKRRPFRQRACFVPECGDDGQVGSSGECHTRD
ncbi:hypothetical protein MTO96_028790 [Rhipicephalus appendiculatus]